MKIYGRVFFLIFFLSSLLFSVAPTVAQTADLPDIDKDRWKVGGFESRQEVETAISRIREATQKEDVYLIKDMFVDFPISVNCHDEKGFF